MSDLKVFVRMYRKLLGDCFLIRFEQGGQSRNMLIDCGVLQGTTDAGKRMRMVADDIRRTCGENIDLIVVTHEHADHLSGFDYADEMFLEERAAPGTAADEDADAESGVAGRKPIGIGKLWLAWTEKDGDPQVKSLRKRFDRHRKLVQKMALGIGQVGSPFAAAPLDVLDGLGAFLGEPGNEGESGLVAAAARKRGRRTLRDIIDALKRRAGERNTCCLEPGQVVRLPFDPGLRVFVLGPPRDPTLLFKDRPSGGSARETYLDQLNPEHELLEMAAGLAEGEPSRCDRSPFAKPHRELPAESVDTPLEDGNLRREALRRWLNAHYFAPKRCRYGVRPPKGHSCADDPECSEDQARRRIDGDWMASGAELALRLDSDTNNTSLVLAIELPDGTFLLFAGDAQVGNWLSWHRQTYCDPESAPPAGRDPVLTAEQILNRTRFYKVGHHGSHNATLKEQGLEMMTRCDLVAMVSTDEQFASRQGRYGWKMPDPKVREAVIEATRGRLIRGDLHRSEDQALGNYPALPDFLGRLDEKDGGESGGKMRDLYVEYRVFG